MGNPIIHGWVALSMDVNYPRMARNITTLHPIISCVADLVLELSHPQTH